MTNGLSAEKPTAAPRPFELDLGGFLVLGVGVGVGVGVCLGEGVGWLLNGSIWRRRGWGVGLGLGPGLSSSLSERMMGKDDDAGLISVGGSPEL